MERRHRRGWSAAVMLGVSGLILALLAPSVSAQTEDDDYPTPPASAVISGAVVAGGTVTITGTGEPGEEVQAVLDRGDGSAPEVLGTTVVNAAGEYSLNVTIPSGLGDGAQLAVWIGGRLVSSTAVGGATGQPPGDDDDDDTGGAVGGDEDDRDGDGDRDRLPVTGTASGVLLTVGLGVVAVGGAALVISRRQRASA